MLKNKTVIVTGASKGIGASIALKFADFGANIVLNYRSEEPKELLQKIEDKSVKCLCVKADISIFEQAKELIQKTKEVFGTIDVLVNNAGIAKDNLIIRMKEEDFDEVINVNLKGTFNTIRHASSIMLKQKSGAIINISSVVGVAGNVGQSNYASSKAGVIGLTYSIAKELASRGITCNAVAPGFIETDMTNNLKESVKKQLNDKIPLKRFGNAEDVANAVVFLATNNYITGQVLNVDGGMIMK